MKAKVKIIDNNWHSAANVFSNLLLKEIKYIDRIKVSYNTYNNRTVFFIIKFIKGSSKENARDIVFTCLKNIDKIDFIYDVKFYGKE